MRETQQPSVLFSPPGNGDLKTPWGPPYALSLGPIIHRVHPLLRVKSTSVVLVLRFADNVLKKPTPRAKGGELWKVTGQPGSMALFLGLEC